LERLQAIELELGRKRERRFGPRTIDIDILLFENEVRTDAHLTLPHPRMYERAFVLTPLRDIMPGFDLEIPEKPGVRPAGRIDDGPSGVFSEDEDRLQTSPVEDIEKTDIM